MTIPDYSLDALNLIKYNIGEAAYVYSFSFDYTPEPPTLLSDCHFFKTYEIEVVLKSDRSAAVWYINICMKIKLNLNSNNNFC